jgi:uncharacterized protein
VTLRIQIRAHPGSGRTGVRRRGEALDVFVTARPVGGRANQALIEAVAEALGVPRSRVRLLRGERGRDKLIEVEGLDRLPSLPGGGPPDATV